MGVLVSIALKTAANVNIKLIGWKHFGKKETGNGKEREKERKGKERIADRGWNAGDA